mgnify:CR=1 FL=1
MLEVKADLIYSNGYTNQALLFYEEIIKYLHKLIQGETGAAGEVDALAYAF